jgi:hypothetical protein
MSNAWNQFVQNNSGKHFDFKSLSHLWKNCKSRLVTLNIAYIHQLHKDKMELQNQVQLLEQQVNQLILCLDYLEYSNLVL